MLRVHEPGGAQPCSCDEIARRLDTHFDKATVRAIFYAARPSDARRPDDTLVTESARACRFSFSKQVITGNMLILAVDVLALNCPFSLYIVLKSVVCIVDTE